MAKATLLTVAEAVGVSRTTVSNAFSRPDQLSPELRARILAAAEELGYSGPSASAAALRTGRTDTIGVLFTDSLRYAFTDAVATEFLAGIAQSAEDAGFALTVVSTPHGAERGPMARAMVDGLIVYSVEDESPGLDAAKRRGLPMVWVDVEPDPAVPSVNVADREGGLLGLTHLIELGHRDLGVVGVGMAEGGCQVVPASATSRHHVVRERLAGWARAARRGGTRLPATISCTEATREQGVLAAKLLLDGKRPPTGIACMSDGLAFGVIDELRSRGLRVPEDVSVIGYDDSAASRDSTPPLTTIAQPVLEKGALAGRLLVDTLAGGLEPAHHTLPVQLVVRGSTGPPPRT
ncbi:LacI family DNA-binding transcriptional regulator [Motilibacter deserti]|uniref:LacI family transcriptional regulator n=1 Tax=Motilibacter deserti TaxID=2714956 RepID=A0ABX0GVU9_9ACTN|nr:LacI family DNA-binding transcriptional regulator [Motilibacter deserti]NHC14680.1 LacI family transcriptional regulator [Motilibacter deserti]